MSSVKAKFILEVVGRPAEHLTTTLNELTERIGQEKGISVVNKEIHKPKPIEKVENLWTSFADLEMEFTNTQNFFNAIMMYLPAHVEVFEPDSLRFTAFELNELANFIVGRLHNYDAIAKKLMGEREILINKLEYIRKGGKIEEVFKPVQNSTQLVEQSEKVKEKSKKKSKKKG